MFMPSRTSLNAAHREHRKFERFTKSNVFNLIFINNLIKHNCNMSLCQKHTCDDFLYFLVDKLDLGKFFQQFTWQIKNSFTLSREIILNEQIFDIAFARKNCFYKPSIFGKIIIFETELLREKSNEFNEFQQ